MDKILLWATAAELMQQQHFKGWSIAGKQKKRRKFCLVCGAEHSHNNSFCSPEHHRKHRAMKITGYEPHSWHFCINDYKKPDGDWEKCPACELKPLVWVFDNGRSTACGCWKNRCDHFSIHAESIMSVHKRTGGKKMTECNSDELRKNWNHWCKTGKVLFKHAGERTDGRW